MTTREIEIIRLAEVTVGKQYMDATMVRITCDKFTWAAYVNSNDEWWEGCGNCEGDSGFKPWYIGIHGGVCFQCGGVGVRRLAGSERALKTLIRKRTSSRLSTLNAAEKAEEKRLAAAEAYCLEHPNLASDLARIRTLEAPGSSTLRGLALALTRGPLSVRQEAYAISLLVERAWDEAHTEPQDVRTYVGEVGERINVRGEISVRTLLPGERYGRQTRVLIVLRTANVRGERADLKMVTAAAWAFNVRKGDIVTISARVSGHTDGIYGPQTEVTHPRKED